MTDCVGNLVSQLPPELKFKVQSLPTETLVVFDTLLRFALGSECPDGDVVSDDTRQLWPAQQQLFTSSMHGSRAEKRSREQVIGADLKVGDDKEGEQTAKKRKLYDGPSDADDTHVFTLNSLSVSSPIRKKADIAVYKSSLRLLNPTTQATESSVPLADIRRAFLIPTRGKSKPHWSVVLLSSDTPASGKGKDASKAPSSNLDQVQVVFGVDAVPATAYTTSEGSHHKGTPVFNHLRTFLSHLPPHISVTEVGLEQEQSQAKGVQAYRRAKEGTLWFLSEGVLWDGKPCEFWDVVDLVGNVPGGEEGDVNGPMLTGAEGVRVVSATGRTCSVFLRRQLSAQGKDEDVAIQVEETDFAMIDGKEQDGILQWVKRFQQRFGQPKQQLAEASGVGKVDAKGKGKAVALPVDEDSDDEEDEDFADDSDSDGGSATSSSGTEDEEVVSAAGEEEEEDHETADEEEDLDPSRHPLLRPGAMPRMSKAAIEAAVGMVTEDLLGSASKGHAMDVDEDEDEDAEEDELED
ncbi:hypothetical protein BC835DRAFT_494661 [Cytidiella melzeri]|nr:hypothetical protein BC835DRAFT_494661 [Cytidiella melzeri]